MNERVRSPLLRRVRGAVGIGLTWAAAWAPMGALTGWVTASALGFPLGTVAANYAVMFGVLGFLGGLLFSSVMGLAEGRREFDQLSLARFVAWGAAGGIVLGGLAVAVGLLGAGLTVLGAAIAGATTLLGAGCAAGTLAIARATHGRPSLRDGGVAHGALAGETAHRLRGSVE